MILRQVNHKAIIQCDKCEKGITVRLSSDDEPILPNGWEMYQESNDGIMRHKCEECNNEK